VQARVTGKVRQAISQGAVLLLQTSDPESQSLHRTVHLKP